MAGKYTGSRANNPLRSGGAAAAPEASFQLDNKWETTEVRGFQAAIRTLRRGRRCPAQENRILVGKPRQYPFQKAIKQLLPRPAAKALDRQIRLRLCDAVVVSYPKCGRTWLRAMLTFYFAKLYGTPKDLLFDFANLHNLDQRIPKIYFSHEIDYKGSPENVAIDRKLFSGKKVVFLARDPRDMIVSLYAHRVHRDKDWSGPIDAFVTGREGGLPTALRYYQLWSEFLAAHDDAMVMRYEDLHADPVQAITALLTHLGQPVDAQMACETVEATSFERLREIESKSQFQSKRLNAQRVDDPQSFKVRRGVVGGFLKDLGPTLARQVGDMMDRELHGAFGYHSAETSGAD